MKNIRNNRSFGILFFLVFFIIGLWPLLSSKAPTLVFIIIAIVFLILGLTNSQFLTPINKLWVKFGELLGRIIAPIVMFIIYSIILTPLSLLIRISGKDLLKLKYLKKTNSYWIKRNKDLGSMNKQF